MKTSDDIKVSVTIQPEKPVGKGPVFKVGTPFRSLPRLCQSTTGFYIKGVLQQRYIKAFPAYMHDCAHTIINESGYGYSYQTTEDLLVFWEPVQ